MDERSYPGGNASKGRLAVDERLIMQARANRNELIETLLQAIERRDIHAMELGARALRGSIGPVSGETSHEAERMEALGGLTEEIEGALRRMRTAAAGEMARIQAAAPLLRHVADARPSPLAEQ